MINYTVARRVIVLIDVVKQNIKLEYAKDLNGNTTIL